jgi:polysaccharide biosynthesis protein PslH
VGRGVKIRLTSYIFARVPMFGYKGAIDGLPLVPGRDFLEAPDQPSLATLCVRHVDDFDLLDRLQRSAFAACDGKFAWADRGPNIVGALLGDGGGRRGASGSVGDRFAA